jgi:tetratricopeptide (TPR) repeat protein
MNVNEYLAILNNPQLINNEQTSSLEKIVAEFSYFQSARALRLKGIYNQNSFRYNFDLKITAAHTNDRSVLFDFITSDDFTIINNTTATNENSEGIAGKVELLDLNYYNIVDFEPSTPKLEQSILASIQEAEQNTAVDLEKEAPLEEKPELQIISPEAERLTVGQPLAFSKEEKHSFQEWLTLGKITPIDRAQPLDQIETPLEIDEEKKKKIELINKFIETSPKIPPVKHDTVQKAIIETNKGDASQIMTETLARVYLEQKKYLKAIQAYEILILKYPEKSSFFADRITDIQILQQNNKLQ